jgi:hypothetical protein
MFLDLSKLMTSSKEIWTAVPGTPDFEVLLKYMSREEVIKLREKCTNQKINRKTREVEKDVDSELFQELYIKAVLVNWKGLKLKYLEKLLPVDLTQVEDLEDELEFSEDNAVNLMKNSPTLDAFVSDFLEDVENFSKKDKK